MSCFSSRYDGSRYVSSSSLRLNTSRMLSRALPSARWPVLADGKKDAADRTESVRFSAWPLASPTGAEPTSWYRLSMRLEITSNDSILGLLFRFQQTDINRSQ
uniref:(northern house mosquito) hypothetical protein n=1 Tax=Culex pipiens TaxID=7175 RepID=A0A8D8BED0_CULPI